MSDLPRLVSQWSRHRRSPLALATVVRAAGSTYRKPGARMFIAGDGTTAGLVSGGCLERDVAEQALHVLQRGAPMLVPYDMRRVLGCNGALEILIEPLDPDASDGLVDAVTACVRERQTFVGATIFEAYGDVDLPLGSFPLLTESKGAFDPARWPASLHEDGRAALDTERAFHRSYDLHAGSASALFQRIAPPIRLFVFGGGPDVAPVIHFARQLGWETAVVVHPAQEPLDLPMRCASHCMMPKELQKALPFDARTVAVVMTHHYGRDLAYLAELLPLPLRYVGLLGPKNRRERLLGDLEDAGLTLTSPVLDRLHSPAGLDLGADGPEEIALSIISEIKAVFAGRRGGLLKRGVGTLHTAGDEMAA